MKENLRYNMLRAVASIAFLGLAAGCGTPRYKGGSNWVGDGPVVVFDYTDATHSVIEAKQSIRAKKAAKRARWAEETAINEAIIRAKQDRARQATRNWDPNGFRRR